MEILPKTHASRFESDAIDQLVTALAKAQQEMKPAKQTSTNPYFKSKYAPLSAVVSASRNALGKHGLSVIQRIMREGTAGTMLLTRLCHASGQWIESCVMINPGKQDIQTIGSHMTYLRRYCYASIVGVVVDDDDDGEKAMGRVN